MQLPPAARSGALQRNLVLVLLAITGAGSPLGASSQGRNPLPPPASRPTVYDPDPTTCQADRIRSGFDRQLAPYADQPEPVLQRLRQVQIQLSLASLRRCVGKGLMDASTARSLAAELEKTAAPPGAGLPGTGASGPEPGNTRPQPSPSQSTLP